jgi:hypothetical protein
LLSTTLRGTRRASRMRVIEIGQHVPISLDQAPQTRGISVVVAFISHSGRDDERGRCFCHRHVGRNISGPRGASDTGGTRLLPRSDTRRLLPSRWIDSSIFRSSLCIKGQWILSRFGRW